MRVPKTMNSKKQGRKSRLNLITQYQDLSSNDAQGGDVDFLQMF